MNSQTSGHQQGKSLQDVKLENRSLLFESIRSRGEISRADLARSTGLTPSTITNIVSELMSVGLIIEDGVAASSGGRRPVLLKVNRRFGFAIGVSLTRSWVSAALADLSLEETIHRATADSSLSDTGEINIPTLLSMIRGLVAEADVPRERIFGIGVSAPGPLDSKNGVLISPPNFPGWSDVPLRQIIEEEIGISTFLDNDANVSALAEKWFGAAKEVENFVYIESDTGVGAGIVINGDLWRGKHNIAGEIGHTTIDPNGPRCGCGNIGCLELYASPIAAVTEVRKAIQAGHESLVQELLSRDLGKLSFETVVRAAQQGDPVSSEAIQSIAQALSIGVINLIHSLDPEAIFIGGAICKAGDLLFDIIRRNVRDRCMLGELNDIPILPSQLGADAPIVGALSLVLREVIQHSELGLTRYDFTPLPLHLELG